MMQFGRYGFTGINPNGTPEDFEKQRDRINDMMRYNMQNPVVGVGDGLVRGIANYRAGRQRRQMDEIEGIEREGLSTRLQELFRTGMPDHQQPALGSALSPQQVPQLGPDFLTGTASLPQGFMGSGSQQAAKNESPMAKSPPAIAPSPTPGEKSTDRPSVRGRWTRMRARKDRFGS